MWNFNEHDCHVIIIKTLKQHRPSTLAAWTRVATSCQLSVMIKINTCGCSANSRPERGCKQLFCRRLSLPLSVCWAEWWRWVSVFFFFSRQCCLIHQALLVLINVVLICILNACSHLRIGMIRETRLLFWDQKGRINSLCAIDGCEVFTTLIFRLHFNVLCSWSLWQNACRNATR